MNPESVNRCQGEVKGYLDYFLTTESDSPKCLSEARSGHRITALPTDFSKKKTHEDFFKGNELNLISFVGLVSGCINLSQYRITRQ